VGQVLAAAMLLEHIGLGEASRGVRQAVEAAVRDGDLVIRAGSPVGGTLAATKAIVGRLKTASAD
jgi:isocitrate/isopropylmalate dehydrogenase